MLKLTYIFFEPLNKNFFPAIAGAYSKVLIKRLERIINDLEKESQHPKADKIDHAMEDYYMPFPACDSIIKSNCTSTECGARKKAVITSSQEKQIVKAIQDDTSAFEKNHEGSNVLINRIKIKFPWNHIGERIDIDEEHEQDHEEYLRYYIKGINGRGRSKRAKKTFVFVRAASDSYYDYINERTKLAPLTPCDEFQKI